MSKPVLVSEHILLKPFLIRSFPEWNNTRVKQVLEHGSVVVNGKIITRYNHPLHPGDKIEILGKQTALREKIKRTLNFPIIHEDDDLLVIDKPAGLLTMGTDDDKFHTAYRELQDYLQAQKLANHPRIYIVHRLDRDASGLIVFAKNVKTKEFLQQNWARFTKKYYALVSGVPVRKSGTIESFLKEDKFKRVYSVERSSDETRKSITRYRLLEHTNTHALLDVTLVTGRKNQIRVHMADLGHPISGDDKYGSSDNAMGRLGLHAYFLSFEHPVTGKTLVLRSSLPGPFASLLRQK